MPEPVLEQIADELFTRLQSVKTDNGYQQTLSPMRPTGADRDIGPIDLRAVLVQLDPRAAEESDIPGNPNAQAWWQLFSVCIFLRPSDSDSVPIDKRVNRVVADVTKAIATPSQWETFGGLALHARFLPHVHFEVESGDHEGVAVLLEVLYRTNESDPYTAR